MGNAYMAANGIDTYIDQDSDACSIYNVVKSVEGNSSNSSSPTDTLLITVDDNIYYQGVNIGGKKFFIKYWINDDMSIRNYLKSRFIPVILESFKQKNIALNYELMVYKDIIRVLVDEKICTNFIQCYGTSSACEKSTILNIIQKNNGVSSRALASDNMSRNMLYGIMGIEGRPSATDNSISPVPVVNTALPSFNSNNTFTYGMIISEYRDGINFEEWYFGSPVKTREEIKIMLFQVCCACYALHLCNVTHNDLHPGNIRVATNLTVQDQIFTYETDAEPGVKIKFQCKYKAMVFDFDRAYARSIGINNINSEQCIGNSYCNIIREGFDFTYFIICIVMHEFEKKNLNYFSNINMLLDIISSDTITKNAILGKIGLSANTSTRTFIKIGKQHFDHPSKCMDFTYQSYISMIRKLSNSFIKNTLLPDAAINNNRILSNLFSVKSGIYKHKKNTQVCSSYMKEINSLRVQLNDIADKNIEAGWENIDDEFSFPGKPSQSLLKHRLSRLRLVGRSPPKHRRRTNTSPFTGSLPIHVTRQAPLINKSPVIYNQSKTSLFNKSTLKHRRMPRLPSPSRIPSPTRHPSPPRYRRK